MKSLRTQLIAAFSLLATGATALFGGMAYYAAREALQESAQRVVQVTATERTEALRQRLEARRMRAMSFLATTRPWCGAGSGPGDADVYACRASLEAWQAIEGFHAAGLSRGGAAPVLLGPGADTLLQVAPLGAGQLARFRRDGGTASYIIRSDDQAGGVSLTLRFDDLEAIAEIFDDPPLLGQGGETFLADEEGFFLTAPRHATEAHDHSISSVPMRRCLAGESSVMLARDYRGADVIHAFVHLDFLSGGCVMAHVHQDEAFAPAAALGRRFAAIGLTFALFASLVSLLLARTITRPISRLENTARVLEQGHLDHPVQIEGPREIRAFALAFGSMTKSLHERTDALAEANQAKTEFLSAMSHELRTPLNAIGGYVELLEMGIHGPVTEAQAHALGRVKKSQAYLLRLINGILNFARLEAGQVEYEISDVRLADVLAELDVLIEPQVRARELEYRRPACDTALAVRADREKLEQVILNLLTNAIKFTDPGGRIDLSCQADGDAVFIRISDTGRGIPAEKLATIFDPFTQVDRKRTDKVSRAWGWGWRSAATSRAAWAATSPSIALSVGAAPSRWFCRPPPRPEFLSRCRRHDRTQIGRQPEERHGLIRVLGVLKLHGPEQFAAADLNISPPDPWRWVAPVPVSRSW
jgi:signal transduction histidine kinase